MRARAIGGFAVLLVTLAIARFLWAAVVVPTDVQQPGTQPREIGNLETPDKCENCHGGYNTAVEPAYNWRGSMMANATRDPLFWATMAIAEQDFDGAGDLCIRCHTTLGWLGGRSTPTDGSGLAASDSNGVDCDTCHKMTNPDRSEHAGVMNPPFVANDGKTPATGYFGSGMLAMSAGTAKLGPYAESDARHQFAQSKFHRSVDFCGSCHDVSNPVVGDLAHNNGAQVPLPAGSFSGVPGAPVDQKAAFRNFPFAYGVVERTFSEYKAGALSKTLVSSYPSLPDDLKAGAIKLAYDWAKGNYADGTPRYFSCQTCHLKAVTGPGCNKNGAPIRSDLPLHDMTGGNYWVPDAILYQNTKGTLRIGGGLTTLQKNAIADGKIRAQGQLGMAASLKVYGNRVRVTNLTGHKLISGYPEGRRMWLNIKWYAGDNLLREDGRYGPIEVQLDGQSRHVESLIDLNDPNTRIYEAHYAMTQEWANQLLALGKSSNLPLAYDRVTGAVTLTLGELAALPPGSYRETFHFVLNNHVAKDNRIPPFDMSYDEAKVRNALPVPATQFGNPGPGGAYNYWDEVLLQPPMYATRATIKLLYQPTSWEYIQFLHLANTRANAFLANEGVNLLDAWLNTGMAAPFTMATATWEGIPELPFHAPASLSAAAAGTAEVNVSWESVPGATSYEVFRRSPGGEFVSIGAPTAASYTDTAVAANTAYLYKARAVSRSGEESEFSNIDLATTTAFTDFPIVPGVTLVKASHITQLRTAVGAVRAAAGLEPYPFGTAPASGVLIQRTHVQELRTALDPALAALGVGSITYTDPTLTAGMTSVKAAHIDQLRGACR